MEEIVKFVDYVATPGEKHLGVATVDYKGDILLRYKITPGKDGNGYFPVVASYKMGDDDYLSSFMIDSRSIHEKIMKCVRDGIKGYMASIDNSEFPL